MPVLLLVRHGQASFGSDDYDQLSELGRRQAAVVGVELRRRGLRDPVAVHGTLRRQRDTAAIALAAAGLALDPVVDPRWDEYDHRDLLDRYGSAGGSGEAGAAPPSSSRQVQDLLDAALLAWMDDADCGGWPAFRSAGHDAVRELAADLGPGRDAVVFTSGGVIAAVCAGLLAGGAATVLALNRSAVNGAMTQLIAGSRGLSVSSFNEQSHLGLGEVTYR